MVKKISFEEKNYTDWMSCLTKLFPFGIPQHCEWSKTEDILSVLNLIGSATPHGNHIFFPTGGGLDIERAGVSHEKGCIEIYTSLTEIVKPQRLMFESFADPLWNYFRLETLPLKPSGVNKKVTGMITEEITEIEPGRYIARSHYDSGEYQGDPLPESARVVTRYMSGSFVIVAKSSPYNKHSATYDGRHNHMAAAEFRAYIERVMKKGWDDEKG